MKGFATDAFATMILSIDPESSFLPMLPYAMFLSVMAKIRSSKDIGSLSSYQQRHICNVAIKYLKTHLRNLDPQCFDALMEEMYFPHGQQDKAFVAADLLEINGSCKGDPFSELWDVHPVEVTCMRAISEYIVTESCGISDLTHIVNKIPQRLVSVLLDNLLTTSSILSIEKSTALLAVHASTKK